MNWHCNFRFDHQNEPIVWFQGYRYCKACLPPGAEPDPDPDPETDQ